MKIAVLGAGAAGCTMAGHLKSMGHEVRLFDLPEFSRQIQRVRREGIRLTGELEGTYMVDCVTTNPSDAVNTADIAMLTVPGFAHEAFMNMCLPHFSGKQILLNWTSYWSCLRFFPRAHRMRQPEVILSEASILPYMTERTPTGDIFVRAIKDQLWIAAMPATSTDTVMEPVKELYPQAIPVENVLYSSLNNLNVPFHVVTAIMNAGHWEQTNGDFDFFGYGITPAVGRVSSFVDEERVAVAKALGVDSPGLPTLMNRVYGKYGAKGDTLYDVLHELRSHSTWRPRVSLVEYGDVREDVPFGLVPLSSLGDQLGVPTPMIDSVICIASAAVHKDFRAIGANVKELGVEGLTPRAIHRYVMTGVRK